ncbi:MAG TPA: transporter substrate-binding domain-containing protein [Gammaproteobacteria bacterium]|nr:transporter substrate-binding domain-containing protein [Gammaproteobacteria bacterium]
MIRQHGDLRVLMLREQGGEALGRDIDQEREMLQGFASDQKLKLTWLTCDGPSSLLSDLERGRGDVVIGDVPLRWPGSGVEPTTTLKRIRYAAVARAHDVRVLGAQDLAGLRVGLNAASPVWPLLQQINAGHAPLRLVSLADRTMQSELLDGLSNGLYDFTVMERNQADNALQARRDLRIAFELNGEEPVSWLVRKNNPVLREALNRHINLHPIAWHQHEIYQSDLDSIEKRRLLRVITRPDPENYFIRNGERAGYEYELIRELARRKGWRVEFLIADNEEQMLAWLRQGYGDVITARLDGRRTESAADLTTTPVYNYVAPVLLARTDIDAAAATRGRRVLIRHNSTLARAWRKDPLAVPSGLKIIETADDEPSMNMVNAVAGGRAEYTIINAPDLAMAMIAHPNLKPIMSLPDPYAYRFTTRAINPRLTAVLTDFLRHVQGSEFHNLLLARYFDKNEFPPRSNDPLWRLSPYDQLVRQYAERYGFDWRLIVAQMYQESRFDPRARSVLGACGLMQLMPETAQTLGYHGNLDDPELSVHGGIRYLGNLRRRFENSLAVEDRTWFAIAAYHAGFDQIRAARLRATRLGLDPNRWFGQVERAMPGMNAPRDAVQSWSNTTVRYVREIRSRYEAYLQLQPAAVAVSSDINFRRPRS